MKKNLSGTLAIDLGNTNTVVAFQDQNNINSVLVEIPNITSSQELFLQQFGLRSLQNLENWFGALEMRDNKNADLFFHSNFKRLIGNSFEKNESKIF